MPSQLQLTAFAHLSTGWAPCGLLDLTEQGNQLLASSFAYGRRYLERDNAIEVDPVSLSLRDRTSMARVRVFPANRLTFFGGIRDAAPDAWGRRVIEAKLKVPANSLPESTYLLHAGSDRVGALDVRESLSAGPTAGPSTEHDLQYLLEAAERIQEGLPVPAHLEPIFMAGTPLGGARPKASVRDDDGVLWLAKFPTNKDAFNVPVVEYAVLRLAAVAGIRVPPLQLRAIGARTVMLIRRFDRYWADPGNLPPLSQELHELPPQQGVDEQRLAFVSGLTLLGCDEMDSPTKSYADLAEAVRAYCHPATIRQDNEELFARMVFNILVSNNDDHLRNHAFLLDPRLGGWRLSPLYDVLPMPGFSSERLLHLGVGPQGRLATLNNALEGHERFTLSRQRACELISRVWRVVREWRTYLEDFGVPQADMEKVSTAFRHLDDVSTPELRRELP